MGCRSGQASSTVRSAKWAATLVAFWGAFLGLDLAPAAGDAHEVPEVMASAAPDGGGEDTFGEVASVVAARYLYTPYGEAHLEKALEIRRIRFFGAENRLGTLHQVIQDPDQWAEGALTVIFAAPLDNASFADGVRVEHLTATGWRSLPESQLLIGSEEALELKVLASAGWQRGSSYRLRLSGIRDRLGRGLAAPETFEWKIAGGAASSDFNRNLAVDFASAEDAADTLGGRFPGGQSMLFQGAWTDPITGLAVHRARWYDQRNASWLREDPLADIDGPNLYGFVGWRPQSGVDPLGLFDKGDSFQADIQEKCRKEPGRCVCQDSVCTYLASLTAGVFGAPVATGLAVAGAPTAAVVEGACLLNPITCTGGAVAAVEIVAGVPNPTSPLPLVAVEQQVGKFVEAADEVIDGVARLAGDVQPLAAAEKAVKLSDDAGSRVLSRGDEFLAYVQGKYGIYAELDEAGFFNFYIRAARGITPPGSSMFREALDAFGSSVRGIRGTWIGGGDLADNFNQYRQGIASGLTKQQAALETFTGKMASRAGFTQVTVTFDEEAKVVVEFTK